MSDGGGSQRPGWGTPDDGQGQTWPAPSGQPGSGGQPSPWATPGGQQPGPQQPGPWGPPPGPPPAYPGGGQPAYQAGSPFYPGYTPYGAGFQPKRTNGMAIGSLVCSLVGLFPFVLPSLVGFILGLVARSQIKKSGGEQTGGGMALAGIIIGAVLTIGWVLMWVLVSVYGHSSNDTYSYNYNSVAHLGALLGTPR